MNKTLSMGWAGVANLTSLAANLYLLAFLANLDVPGAGDAGMTRAGALATNAGLLLLFGLQHSVMARDWFKERWTAVVPEHLERATYVLVASLTLGIVLWLWQPLPELVWSLSGPAEILAWGGFGLGLGIMGWANLAMEPEEFQGVRQVRRHFGDEQEVPDPPGFRTPGLYRYVRHPLYLGFLLIFWSTPDMSIGRVLFAAGATAYVLVGARFEERTLRRRFGEDYARYRERVPMLIPRPTLASNRSSDELDSHRRRRSR